MITFQFQVLSKTVSVAMALNPRLKDITESTRYFIEMFDRFFDMLNVRKLGQDTRNKKPDLAPYTDQTDSRFEVLVNNLSYNSYLIILPCIVNQSHMIERAQQTFFFSSG